MSDAAPPYDAGVINDALSCVRSAIAGKIGSYLAGRAAEPGAYTALYDLLRDYPFRQGKMLRPAICISAARALGGMGHSALTVATALELYHKRVPDPRRHRGRFGEPPRRRHGCHRRVGVARAINAGDANQRDGRVGLLLENLAVVGVAKALHLLHESRADGAPVGRGPGDGARLGERQRSPR